VMSKFLVVIVALAAVAVAQPTPAQCTTYCNAFITGCATDYPIYADQTACMAECSNFPLTSTCAGSDGCATAATENSYDCRLYHVQTGISTSNTAFHCPHATPLSSKTEDNMPNSGQCLDANTAGLGGKHGLVEDLCNQISLSCGKYMSSDPTFCYNAMYFVNGIDTLNGDPMYPTMTTKFPISAPAAGSNTVACRRYHAQVARTDAATHCPHAIFGAGVCGSDCDFYCGLIQGACTVAWPNTSRFLIA